MRDFTTGVNPFGALGGDDHAWSAYSFVQVSVRPNDSM
jgi:hypothetical protein